MSKAVSLVIPFLNEEDSVPMMLERFIELDKNYVDYDFEYVLVDDGSIDNTIALLEKNASKELKIKIISLSRNFGSHAAISAGLASCKGECAIILGADLQEPPVLIEQFLEQYNSGFEIIWGIRSNRAKKGLGTLISSLFSKLFNKYSEIKSYPAEGPSGFLIARNVIDTINTMPERHRNVLGLIAWSGFRQTRVNYEQLDRVAGVSKWTSKKLFKLAVDSFVQFSSSPIRAMTYLGSMTAFIGFIYAIVIAIRSLFFNWGPSGWATVTVLILVLGGLQLITLGVLGEYIWRGVDETRGRPLYVVRSEQLLSEGNDNG